MSVPQKFQENAFGHLSLRGFPIRHLEKTTIFAGHQPLSGTPEPVCDKHGYDVEKDEPSRPRSSFFASGQFEMGGQ